jgi:hypothetical protein
MPSKILKVEGLIICLFALYWYFKLGGGWQMLVLLFFTPDVSMIGYLQNSKIGSYIYNFVHNYILGLALFVIGVMYMQNELIGLYSFILIAHVGLDRFCGFGLKYPSHFKDTHLQKV